MNHDVSSLNLLSEWCNVEVDKFNLGLNEHGYRGLLASINIEEKETILLIPWKHVLGMRAARQLMDVESSKGRGMDDDDFLLHLIVVCQGLETRLWSCTMACAILSGLRYPLSAWSPYIACLPHHDASNPNSEPALRRVHALTARQSVKQQAKRDNNNTKMSQEILNELRIVREKIMAAPRGNDNALVHVLLWNETELNDTNDAVLVQEVKEDQKWLQEVWEQLFNAPRTKDDDDEDNDHEEHTPIISLQSWMWAHAIVRSRAIGLEKAPKKIMTMEYKGYTFHSKGVLIPIVDLINHDSSSRANAALEIRPEGVAVVSTKIIDVGQEILFDYHPEATLSFLLRSYGFVDASSQQQRQILETLGGLVEVDIMVTSCCSTTNMLQLVTSDYDESTGRLRLVLRDDSSSLQSDSSSLETWNRLHQLAACACFSLMESFDGTAAEHNNGSNSTAVSYRETTFRLLQRAWQDLSAVTMHTSIEF
jgi:hypothetical protein